MKKFVLKNMGCKSNQFEGSIIEETLIASGYKKNANIQDSDIFILNSCTVTHKSDNEAFAILARAKKDNPNIKTVLTGCIAQVEKQKLLENPNIDFVIGNDEKLEIVKYLNEDNYHVSNLEELNEFHNVTLSDTTKTRASLKIQDGCDNRCSYCIIPFARGKNRSADIDFIINQINKYEQTGFKEIVLTGIHIGQWGKEREAASVKVEKNTLLNLLQTIEEKTSIHRYRLGSLNPLEIDDKMLDFLVSSEKVCPHFHLSLQSMNNKTLKAMNRHYTVEHALELIDKIYDKMPLAFMGSDIIAGFPDESDDDFQVTVNNLEKSKLSQIHTFPYSVRKGTVAESMPNQVPQKIKDLRASVIKDISARKHDEFLKRNSGQILDVLIEKNLDKKTGMLKGVTQNYINVLIDSTEISDVNLESVKNSIQKVSLQYTDKYILGNIVESMS